MSTQAVNLYEILAQCHFIKSKCMKELKNELTSRNYPSNQTHMILETAESILEIEEQSVHEGEIARRKALYSKF